MTNYQDTDSRHVRSLIDGRVVHAGPCGCVRRLTANEFPALERLSIKRIELEAGAIRVPHWHANANELAYCVAGELLVSILDNDSAFSRIFVGVGQMFHIDSGALHTIENVGPGRAELVIAFGSERPEDFSLHAAFGAMSDAVLGNTYDLPASDFAGVPRDRTDRYLVPRTGESVVPSEAHLGDPHRFDVEAMSAPVASVVGSVRTARSQFWPVLKDLSMYSLRIADSGMREPHWHPRTAEMGYIHRGRARMTIMDPDGTVDTYELKVGDVYFVPRAYPHHIEVIGDEEIHFLIFFDQPTPGDVGFCASATSVSADVMAAGFGMAAADFPALPFTAKDPLIVARANPRDPV